MRDCASIVLPPICGVRITLRRPWSGEWKGSVFFSGSSGKTSTAAPPRWPLSIAAFSAPRSSTRPRALLSRMAPGFISAISSAPMRFCVATVSGTCSVTTSAPSSSARSEGTESALPCGSFGITS